MITAALRELMGPALAGALDAKGYASLTSVQEAVLVPELVGRDMRISSQTGSGKTLAIGLIVREAASLPSPVVDGKARPHALVIVPTRELARQVEEELSWFFAPLGAQVVSVTGGTSYRDERRSLARGATVLVGTPGRLLDYLERDGIDASGITAVVLDEADRMLDLGFRDALEAIMKFTPEGHRTHLVSATFPPDVKRLADRIQENPAHVQGTPLGTANADIDHVLHLVLPDERISAMVNLLLANTEGQTIVFARTRADVAEISGYLQDAGFRVTSLSGEMEQRERNRALAAFKRGDLHALVATDVAARGIDVQDIARVIHAEPPTDADTYTHRSGRTGRAGRKGVSSVLATPQQFAFAKQLLKRARVNARFEPIPTAEAIRAANDERLFGELTSDEGAEPDARLLPLAERLAEGSNVVRTLARLLSRSGFAGPAEPREVKAMAPPERASRPGRDRDFGRGPAAGRTRDRQDHGSFAPPPPRAPRQAKEGFVPFRVTWGGIHGADPRRLLAMVCRRGGIRGGDVGSIDVQRTYSVVDIAEGVARSFAQAAERPDPRDPRIRIQADAPLSSAPPAPKSKRAVADEAPATSSRALPDAPVSARSVPEERRSRRSVATTEEVPPPAPKSKRVIADAPKSRRTLNEAPEVLERPTGPFRKGPPKTGGVVRGAPSGGSRSGPARPAPPANRAARDDRGGFDRPQRPARGDDRFRDDRRPGKPARTGGGHAPPKRGPKR